ncbi:MAG: hypothetical protein KF712_10245 [Akkermansiaceae bacterium]|nr:hypothetical protein [Akkermansiaceae bacterium]
MEILKNRFLWIAIMLTILAMICDDWSAQAPLQFKNIQIAVGGELVEKSIIETPMANRLVRLFSITIYSLAAGVFISAFVTNFIESQRAREHQDELRRLENSLSLSVFEALFKKLVPDEVFECIKSEFLLNSLIRRDVNLIFDFSYGEEKIVLKQTLSYNLENLTDSSISDPIGAIAEQPMGDEESELLLRASCIIDSKHILAYDRIEKPAGITETTDVHGNRLTEINFEIPARKSAEVTLVWRSSYKICKSCCYFRDAFFTTYPIINGSLIVNKPSDMKFDLFQVNSTKFEVSVDEPERIMYKLRGAMLSKQGLLFTFGPR